MFSFSHAPPSRVKSFALVFLRRNVFSSKAQAECEVVGLLGFQCDQLHGHLSLVF